MTSRLPVAWLIAFLTATLGLSACCPGGSSSDPTPAANEGTAPGTGEAPGHDAWQKLAPSGGELAAQVKAGVGKGTARSLKPIVYIGAEWCDPCQAIHRYQSDPKMVDAFKGTYVIELDLDDWKAEDLKALGYKAGSIPVFISVDAEGKAKGPMIDGGAWGDNIPKNMAPPLKAFFAVVS